MPAGQPSSDSSKPRSDNADVFRRVRPQMAALDEFLAREVGSFEEEIQPMARYCMETSGKRLRPTLVFLSGWRGDAVVDEPLVRAAGVVEMVHLATLVHDDIMDGAEMRRNRRTVSREFGPDAAVLLGDALFSQALHVASQFPTPEVCRLVSESTRRVCSGEIMQTLRRRDLDISLDEYRRIIDLKTAELFRVSCRLGAKLGGHPAEFVGAADKFGSHLGIAYQIYDDLVDFVGEEQRIGKTLGTDLATGKLTLPLMLLLENLPADERAALVTALKSGQSQGLAASVKRMRDLGIAEGVVASIEKELGAATSALERFSAVPATSMLLQLCDLLRASVGALQRPAAIG